MRLPSTQRSHLRYPLDAVFNSAAQVRLIRVLAHEVSQAVSVADAARLSGLTPAGARKALERLEHSGVVERIGSGRAQKWSLKEGGPFDGVFRRLFDDEEHWYEDLIGHLRAAVSLPEISSAWIARMPKDTGQALDLEAVIGAESVSWMSQELRSRLANVEKRFDLVVEVDVCTRADAPAPNEGAVFLWGTAPDTGSRPSRQAQSHTEAERRALVMAEVVADLLRTDPSLLKRANQHLNRLVHEGQGMATGDLAEWRQLLETYSSERLRELLVSSSSRAQRLRQSAPFYAVLSPDQRDRVMAEVEKRR
jgi:DNA-binding Lrp family transcriptional regulator